jgi:hypothetical protein
MVLHVGPEFETQYHKKKKQKTLPLEIRQQQLELSKTQNHRGIQKGPSRTYTSKRQETS